MPILRDAGILDQRFGNFVVGAGAVGEFGPVVIVSVILAFEADEPLRALLLFAFAAIVVGAALLALRARPGGSCAWSQTTMGTSGQLAVRLSVLLVVALAVLATEFGLDVILGAFAAGIVVGIVIRGTEAEEFLGKLDAVGFGFLIPVFFIATGMDYDLDALFSNAVSLVLVPGFRAALPAHPRPAGDAALPRRALARRPGLAGAVLGRRAAAAGRDHRRSASTPARCAPRSRSRWSAPGCSRCSSTRCWGSLATGAPSASEPSAVPLRRSPASSRGAIPRHPAPATGAGVLGRVEAAQGAGEAEAEVGPQRGVAARSVQVPARAAALEPDGARHPRLDRVVPGAAGPRRVTSTRLEPVLVACGASACIDVAGLRLGHVDDRVVAEARCSARAAGRGSGSRRPSSRGAPAGCRPSARRACARRRRAMRSAIGMSRTWKPVPRMIVSTSRSRAVGADDRAAADLGDPLAEHLDVRLGERRAGSRWRPGSACSPAGSRGSASRAARGSGDLAAQVRLGRPRCSSGASATRSIGIANASRAQ